MLKRPEIVSYNAIEWMSRTIVLLASLTISACAHLAPAEDELSPGAIEPVKVYLLAGQSNMDGRGDGTMLSDDDHARLVKVQDRVMLAYNGEPVRPLGLTTPQPWVAKKFDLEKTFGPELFFGIEMAEALPTSEILLIKRSLGGTSLYGSWNPNWSLDKADLMGEADRPMLYSELLKSIDLALTSLEPGTFDFAGVLWVQGETDSNVKKFGPLPAESYGENLASLIAAIRRDVGAPDLPFHILQVGGGAVVDGMRETSTAMRNVYFIPQSYSPDNPNYLPKYGPPVGHYNYTGMKRIGLLFSDSVLTSSGTTQ